MSYEPNVVSYVNRYYDVGEGLEDNPEITEITPVLDDLFMDTEVALYELASACSRNHLESAYKTIHEIYDKVADLRHKYQDITAGLYHII